MSRIALLLLGSALMLIVAACDTNGDDTDTDSSVENETEVPADDGNGDDEEAATEESDESDEGTEETDEATDSEEEATSEEDDVAQSGEEESTPAEEGTAQPEQPGPNEGMFFDLTVEEANDLTDFEVKEPQEVPESVEFQTIMGMASQQASEEERSEEAATIIFSYSQPPEDETQQGLPVELTQSSELDMSASLPPDTDQEQITIGDREITQVNLTDESGNDVVAYMWNEDDIHYSLAAILGPDLDEGQLEDMLASIPNS